MGSREYLDLVFLMVLTGIVLYGFLGFIINGLSWLFHELLTNKIVQGAALFSIAYLILRLLFSDN